MIAAVMAMNSCDKHDGIYSAPFGALAVFARHDVLNRIDFLQGSQYSPPTTRIAAAVFAELDAYFADPKHIFSLPVALSGSDFQRRVWQMMMYIPVGSVRTYGDVADELVSGPRAVGGACAANPLPIVIPCHRIVSKRGMGGFNHTRDGAYITVKRWLLAHEGVCFN